MKRIVLYLCSSSSRFSATRVREFGILNPYFWFWKSLSMAKRDSKVSFFRGNHVKIGIRIDISISIRSLTPNVAIRYVHLEELTQRRLIKKVLVTPSRQYHVTNKNNISPLRGCLWLPTLAGWFDHLVLRDHVTN